MDAAVQHSNAMSATYAVPQRFGMAGILAITTFMAILFGVLRYMGGHPVAYVFFGVLALVTCLVQMRYGSVPRMASVAVGAIFLPVCVVGFVLLASTFDRRFQGNEWSVLICSLPFSIPLGALCGYLCGACTAGIFLLMDLIEPYLPGGGVSGPKYARPVVRKLEPVLATLVTSPKQEQVLMALLADNPYVPAQAQPTETDQEQPTKTAPPAEPFDA